MKKINLFAAVLLTLVVSPTFANEVSCRVALENDTLQKVESYSFTDGREISTLDSAKGYGLVALTLTKGTFNLSNAIPVKILDIRLTDDGAPRIFVQLRNSDGLQKWLSDFEVGSLTPVAESLKYFEKRIMVAPAIAKKIKLKGSLR